MKTNDTSVVSEREKARRARQAMTSRAAWSVEEGAHRIGVGRTSIYKLAAEGKIRLIKIAGRTLIPDSEITRLVEGEAK
jgi:excisionase family DNA binding protein